MIGRALSIFEGNQFRFLFVLLTCGILTTGCASAPDPSDAEAYAEWEEINDPLEPMNRGFFTFNRGLDTLLLKPLAIMYKEFLPPPFQRGIHNFLDNVKTPVVLANNLLQTDMPAAGNTLSRFLVNTTLGVGGLGDPATDLGLERKSDDFGMTLAVWGVGEGPYLMLPILGPSNPRDASGMAVDSLLLDPIGLLGALGNDKLFPYSMARTVLTAVDTRSRFIEELDEVEKTSLDFYAAVRSLYRQNRRAEINALPGMRGQSTGPDGDEAPGLDDMPDITDEPEQDSNVEQAR
jgi:phospholipid-binding lipoprotein MlaA